MKRVVLLALFLFGWLGLSASYGQAISPYIAGQNAWAPKGYGGVTFNNGQLEKLWRTVKKSKVQLVRIGGASADYNRPSGPEYLALIDSIRAIGAEPVVQVSQGRGLYTAQQAASTVDYINNQQNRHVKYWSISNEPDLNGSHGAISAAGVQAYIMAFSSAMKAVDPTILIMGPECTGYNSYYPALIGGANDITGQDANGRYYLDIVTFHHYPFSGTQTRAQVMAKPQDLNGNVTQLLNLMATANSLHNRTGVNALQWALTEFNVDYLNPTVNTVEGVGPHSFLNGQFWADVFRVGMARGSLSMMPWSIHESNGARTSTDLGYLDGSTTGPGPAITPRSSFYHEMLVAENLHGTYLPPTVSPVSTSVSVLSSTDNGTTAVMLLNKSNTDNYDFTVQLSTAAVPGSAAYKINVPAGINVAYTDNIYAQSTLVLLFDNSGALVRKITYSLAHADQFLPPSYRLPGKNLTAASFFADKTTPCTNTDQVIFTPAVVGTGTLSWNFGAGATPQVGTGNGPFAVSYATTGSKTIALTLTNADTTFTVTKTGYVQAATCAQPYSGTAAVIPGVVKAVEFDTGGEGVAYHDSDVANQGALLDPTVPRANESVDTENGGEGNGDVGYTMAGEWLKYTVNVLRSSLYKVTLRVAASAAGGSVRLSVDGVDKTGPIAIPATGSATTYQDVVISNVYLGASTTASLRCDIVSGGLKLEKITFAEQPITGIVINRIYNATSTGTGMSDAVELLVTKDMLDIRGLIIKDFETNLTSDTGGRYQFKDNPLWQSLRIGTTIVLRRIASGISGYTTDVDASDFTLDMLLENSTYLDNQTPTSQNFNLTNTDMVLLKTGLADGVANAVHAFATNGGGGSAFFSTVSPSDGKLVATTILNTLEFKYSTNPTQSTADYNGTNTATSTDTNLNWGYGYGTANINYINTLRNAAFTPPTIVVNRVYNGSNDGNGNLDAVELLVVKDHQDLRSLIVKDFESNNTLDTGGQYQFKNIPFWQDVRIGTTIVLRRLAGPSGYVADYNAADFTLDMLLDNPAYLTNLSTGTNVFNITQYDMVLLKTGLPTGVDGAIHAFATKGGGNAGVPSALYQSVRSAKLTSPDGTDAGATAFHYPLNPSQSVADYGGAKGAISKSAALNWGYGFGTPNINYIQSLRTAAPPANLTVVSGQSVQGSGAYSTITVQSGGTLTLAGPLSAGTAVQVQTGGTLITDCQPLSGAGSFELQAGAELQICDPAGIMATGTASGAVQLTGTRTYAADATYTYNGTAAQTTGTGLPAQVRNLTLNNASGLSLSQDLSIMQVARLQSGDLTTGGLPFTLLSSAAGTALLDNTGGVVQGFGTMQRAITATVTGPAYRHFSSPVASATFSSLAVAGFTPTFNTAYNSSATPGSVSPFPTVFGYDESRLASAISNYSAFDKGWFSPSSATNVMLPTRGYSVNAPAATVPVAFTGMFNNATQASGPLSRGTDAQAGWQLLGNPYPSPLDWSTVAPAQRPGMDAAIYVFQSTGQYAGTYRSYANGMGDSPLIDAGSGYFARVTTAGTPGAVNLTNANRVTTFGPQPAFGRTAADARPQLHLRLAGASLADDTFLYLEAGATAGVDALYDATKLANPTGLDLASLSGNTALAINGLPLLTTADVVVPLTVRVPQAGQFEFTVIELANMGAGILYLRDALAGTQRALTAGGQYSVALTAGAGVGRFSLVLRPGTVTATQPELTAAAIGLYPNPAHDHFTLLLPPLAGQRTVQASLVNSLGQVVLSHPIGLTAAGTTVEITTKALAAGVYVLRLQTDTQLLTKRLVLE